MDGSNNNVAIHILDEANEDDNLLHKILLILHFILALIVFGAVGSMVYYERKRMKKLKVTTDTAEFTNAVPLGKVNPAVSTHKKHARQFAAQYALYRADYFLSTTAFAKPLLLLLITYLTIILGGFFYAYISGLPFLEAIWLSWTMVADPGAHGGEFKDCKVIETTH
jgi:hypothetical protein